MTYLELLAVFENPRKRPDGYGRKKLSANVSVSKSDTTGELTIEWWNRNKIMTYQPGGRIVFHLSRSMINGGRTYLNAITKYNPTKYGLARIFRIVYWYDTTVEWLDRWYAPYSQLDWVDVDANYLDARCAKRDFAPAATT